MQIFKILMLAVMALTLSSGAFAQVNTLSVRGPSGDEKFKLGQTGEDRTIINVAMTRVDTIHSTLRQLTYVLAGIGLIGMVIMAAIGKFQWKYLFALAGGLFLLAGFQAMINFLN